jgi:hypothetical protein
MSTHIFTGITKQKDKYLMADKNYNETENPELKANN